METVWLTLKGLLMGISNIIPGVSGGTMAVSLGIYDDLIFSITRFFKDKKKSIRFLLPIGIGLAVGIVFFSYAIEFLLSTYAFITSLAFIGLILGGFPILSEEFQQALQEENKKVSLKHGLVFFFFLALIIGSSLLQEPVVTAASLEVSSQTLFTLFMIGVIASATMIIPGVSGSLVLMLLGYYYQLLQLLTTFFNNFLIFNWGELFKDLTLIAPVGMGLLFGVLLVSRGIEWLFKKIPSLTYSGILGLVLASPFAILHNANALEDLAQSNTFLSLGIGGVLLAVGFCLTFQLSHLDEQVAS